MTIERVPEQNRTQSVTLPARAPGSALAVLALGDELAAERAAHAATKRELVESRVRARVARVGVAVFDAWALPWIGGGVPPWPDAPPPVDLSTPPLIFDELVAEFTAAPPGPSRPRRRRLLAVLVGALIGAAIVGAATHRKA